MKRLKWLLLILTTSSLTAWYEIDPEAEGKMKELVNQESEALITQAIF